VIASKQTEKLSSRWTKGGGMLQAIGYCDSRLFLLSNKVEKLFYVKWYDHG